MRLPIRPHKSEPDIVEFRAAKSAAIQSPRHQHLAVGQQRRCVQLACGGEVVSVTPSPAGRVVQFLTWGEPPTCRQHLAVRQQRRRVKVACMVEAASGAPSPADRVVQFRAGKEAAVTGSSCRQHLAVRQQRRRLKVASGGEAARGAPCPAGRVV